MRDSPDHFFKPYFVWQKLTSCLHLTLPLRPPIVTLARGESLSEPRSSLTLLSTINFPQQASWCPALRGKPRLLQAEPSPLVKVGWGAVCTGGSQVPEHQPSPRARVTATGGGAKHAAFTPSISSLPDNFCTIHPGPLPRKFQFSSDSVKTCIWATFPLFSTKKFIIMLHIVHTTVVKSNFDERNYGQTVSPSQYL